MIQTPGKIAITGIVRTSSCRSRPAVEKRWRRYEERNVFYRVTPLFLGEDLFALLPSSLELLLLILTHLDNRFDLLEYSLVAVSSTDSPPSPETNLTMKLISYQKDRGPRIAALRGNEIIDLQDADPSLPSCPRRCWPRGRKRSAAQKKHWLPAGL